MRRRLRLLSFDYAENGAYFVTAVTARRCDFFGDVRDDNFIASTAGLAVEDAWHSLESRYSTLELDAFVVMPNHVHGILWLHHATLAADAAVPSVPDLMRVFKSLSARAANAALGRSGAIWQRSYHERVIRNERELMALREYIKNNPSRWALDHENANRGHV